MNDGGFQIPPECINWEGDEAVIIIDFSRLGKLVSIGEDENGQYCEIEL